MVLYNLSRLEWFSHIAYKRLNFTIDYGVMLITLTLTMLHIYQHIVGKEME